MISVETTVSGIPCRAVVTRYFVQKACAWADNPDDYYGYTEIEFDLHDRKGYPAPWLERKLTSKDRERVEFDIKERMQDERSS